MSCVVNIVPVLNRNGLYDINNLSPMDIIELEKAITFLNKNRESNRKYQRKKSGGQGGVIRTVQLNLVNPLTRRLLQEPEPVQQTTYSFHEPVSFAPLTLNVIKQ